MAKVEYRSERLDENDSEQAVAQLNRWGAQGWQVFHMERTGDGFQVWLSRALETVAAGLQSAR